MHSDLSPTAQTAYSQLLDACLNGDYLRSVAGLPGSFAKKTVRGAVHWYFQYTEPAGKLRQIYVGPDNESVQGLMAKRDQPTPKEAVGRLARAAEALGCTPVLPQHFRVIDRLADYGFFRAGGVLIGTHAFLAYGNMLGVQWDDASRTQDVDFAHAGRNLAIVLPGNVQAQTHTAIESLAMGFLPINGLRGKAGATYLNPRDPDFRLDFLTTWHRGGDQPFEHPELGVTLQPIRFVEYILENIQQAALFAGTGATLVNVPDPARYALHKLIVHSERRGTYAAKSEKDLQQAAALLDLLRERRAWDVEAAWADLLGRGEGWQKRAHTGLKALDRKFPTAGLGPWLASLQHE